MLNPNGGHYYNGTVTFGAFKNNETYRGGLINVDPKTKKATTLLNSYFRLEFGSPDDPVWVRCGGKVRFGYEASSQAAVQRTNSCTYHLSLTFC